MQPVVTILDNRALVPSYEEQARPPVDLQLGFVEYRICEG